MPLGVGAQSEMPDKFVNRHKGLVGWDLTLPVIRQVVKACWKNQCDHRT